MRTIKSKKGAAHVEMVISFVIFISFIAFIIIVFRPLSLFSRDTSSLDITESEILDHISSNLTIISLTLAPEFTLGANPGDCFYITFNLQDKVIIRDENLITGNATKSGSFMYFIYTGKFYKVYSSSELTEKPLATGGCSEIDEENYTIGVTKNYDKVAYSKLLAFKNDYDSDYVLLKQNLGLKNDFNVIVRNSSGIIFEAKEYEPEGIETRARNIPIEILDGNANLNTAIINIQVWE